MDALRINPSAPIASEQIATDRSLDIATMTFPAYAFVSAAGMIAMKGELPQAPSGRRLAFPVRSSPMVAQAVILGGHVRVGLEDNLYIRQGVLAQGNAQLVERAVTLIESLGSQVVTPGEAREILELPAQHPS